MCQCSTLNLMKQCEQHTQYNLKKINFKINNLLFPKINDSFHRSEFILSLSVHLFKIAKYLQKMHASMITLLANTIGRISPVSQTLQQFSEEVDNITEKLLTELQTLFFCIVQSPLTQQFPLSTLYSPSSSPQHIKRSITHLITHWYHS